MIDDVMRSAVETPLDRVRTRGRDHLELRQSSRPLQENRPDASEEEGRRTNRSMVNDRILQEALKSPAAAHGVHEKELGRPDPDWPQWYAEHMTRTLGGAGYHLTGPSALMDSEPPGKNATCGSAFAGRRVAVQGVRSSSASTEAVPMRKGR